MAIRLSEAQVVEATGAVCTQRGGAASFTSVSTDTRQATPGALFVALVGDRYDAHQYLTAAAEAGAVGVVVAAGRARQSVPAHVSVFEVEDTLQALGGLGRLHRRRFHVPVAAVTGSNGKTTTKELVAAILSVRGLALKTQGNLNNEVGVPLTLFNLAPEHVAAVVEMGMNHAGEISRLCAIAEPDAGLITVVQPAHLEGLGSLEGVAQAKGELFRGLGAHATAVVNLDDARVAGQAKGLAAKVLTYGRAPEADVRLAKAESAGRAGWALVIQARGQHWPVRLKLVGEHNAMNATGAFALALALGYSPEECVKGLEAARSHSRRLELLDAPGGVTVVDDCYNANPASMTAALETLTTLAAQGRAVAVLGDMLELGAEEAAAHTQMGPTAASHAALVAFFGRRMRQAFAAAQPALGERARHFEDVGALVAWLQPQLQPHDVVLVKGSRGMRLERVVEGLTGIAAKGGH
jgi:UDP-N-acetylmuramoyl-tripeptide--D-alanyl-D-alanine ligase